MARATVTNGLIVILGLLVSAMLLALTGADVAAAATALVEGSVGSPEAIRQSLLQATPILIAGLGVSFALRAGLVNIGADGQLYIGALFASVVTIFGPPLPWPFAAIVMLGAAMLGGFLWGALPGWMRGRLGMSEVITTLLLNFVAFWIVSWAVHGPINDPLGGGYPWTPEVPDPARLPVIRFGGFFLPTGILLGLVLAVVISFVLHRTHFGFELRVLGDSPAAARWAGVNVPRRIIQALAISGALAGIAGAAELAGNQYRLSDFFSPGFGFTALVVALVGRATPSGTVAAALFFGALAAGGGSMERIAQVPASTGLVVQGTIIAILVASRSAAVQSLALRARRRVVRPSQGPA
jgi:simple sugar transport system permease protein